MSETDHTGYRESPDTTDGPTESNMIDGVSGEDRSDGGEADVTLTTDDEAQRDDSVVRGGNVPD
ncbi:hypothetical protein [Geodermatophilus sp. FMUSA9-8]|uniref:hypothetical protein n=1 Tax=Geodermatophilus sp. FMUSA9-8 TaxID=3120155 RepID=UPI00300BBDF2